MLRRSDKILLDTLLPANAHPRLPKGLEDTGFEPFWESQRGAMSTGMRLIFRAGLLAANWASPLLLRRLPPLARYERPIREQALRAMDTSRFFVLRKMLQVLKLVASMCYAADRQVRSAVGYSEREDISESSTP